MKKTLRVILFMSLFSLLMGCATNDKKEVNNSNSDEYTISKESKYEISDDLVSMRMTGFLSISLGTVTLTNHTDQSFIYGTSFLLEYEKKGIWYTLDNINPLIFTSIGYTLGPRESVEKKINWGGYYGELKSGKYRVVDYVLPEDSIDPIYIVAEFIIE